MTNVESQRLQLGDADHTASGLPEWLMERQPSYVKALTDLEVAAMSRRRSGGNQNVSRGPLAERIANNWQEETLLVSPSLLTGDTTQFRFKNSHWTPIYLALSGGDEQCEIDCGYDRYVTGWFELAPAETWTWSDPTGNSKILYYAEATDGSVYDGSIRGIPVMHVQFRVCECDSYYFLRDESSPWYPANFDYLNLDDSSGVEFF